MQSMQRLARIRRNAHSRRLCFNNHRLMQRLLKAQDRKMHPRAMPMLKAKDLRLVIALSLSLPSKQRKPRHPSRPAPQRETRPATKGDRKLTPNLRHHRPKSGGSSLWICPSAAGTRRTPSLTYGPRPMARGPSLALLTRPLLFTSLLFQKVGRCRIAQAMQSLSLRSLSLIRPATATATAQGTISSLKPPR